MQVIESGALRAPLSIFLYFPHVNRLINHNHPSNGWFALSL